MREGFVLTRHGHGQELIGPCPLECDLFRNESFYFAVVVMDDLVIYKLRLSSSPRVKFNRYT